MQRLRAVNVVQHPPWTCVPRVAEDQRGAEVAGHHKIRRTCRQMRPPPTLIDGGLLAKRLLRTIAVCCLKKPLQLTGHHTCTGAIDHP